MQTLHSIPTHWQRFWSKHQGWLMLLTLTLVVYLPAIFAGSLFDDKTYLLTDPLIQSPSGIWQIWTNPMLHNEAWPYLPLTRSSFWLEVHTFGWNFKIFHGVNILLHALTTILLYLGLRSFQVRYAFLIAVCFAIHPSQVQSVAWITERKNVLSGVFFVSTIWSYLHLLRTQQWRWAVPTLGSFCLALLSKEATVMIPPLLILCQLWLVPSAPRKYSLVLLPMFALSAAASVFRIWMELNVFGAARPELELIFWQRLFNSARVFWFYILHTILPFKRMMMYPKWGIDYGEVLTWLSWVGIFAIVILCYLLRHSHGKKIALTFCAYGVLIFPILGFFNNAFFRFSWVADHWVYLPCIPLFIAGVHLIQSLLDKIKLKFLPLLFWVVLFIMWGSQSYKESKLYETEEIFWIAQLVKNPNAWLALNNLGHLYLENGKMDEAIRLLDQAILLYSRYEVAYLNRSAWHMSNEHWQQAIADLDQALSINPGYALALNNRGFALWKLNQTQDALKDFAAALVSNPRLTKTYLNRIKIWQELQKKENIAGDFKKVLELEPFNLEVLKIYLNYLMEEKQFEQVLAFVDEQVRLIQIEPSTPKTTEVLTQLYWLKTQVYEQQHTPAEKLLEAFNQTLQVNPNFVEARVKKALLLSHLKRHDEAVKEMRDMVQANPLEAELYNNFAVVLTQAGKYQEALEKVNEAIQLNPNMPEVYDNRGRLHFSIFHNRVQACADFHAACNLGSCESLQMPAVIQFCK